MAIFGAAATNANQIVQRKVAQPPSDSVSNLSFSPKANLLVATSWDNQSEFKRVLSPLKYQQGFLVGSIEGRVGVHHLDKSQSSKNFTFKCHRDGNDIFSVNSLNFHPQISLDSTPPNEDSPSQLTDKTGVIVIGAGLAGLAAATRLQAENIPFLLLEASNAVGRRVRKDFVDGFVLDHGFQIFITGYPEAQKVLDYNALNLERFYSGARVYYGGGFHTVAVPCGIFSMLFSR